MDIKIRYKDQRIETFHNMTNFEIGINWIHFDSDEGYQCVHKNEIIDFFICIIVRIETTDLESKESNQFLYAVMAVLALLSILVYFLY